MKKTRLFVPVILIFMVFTNCNNQNKIPEEISFDGSNVELETINLNVPKWVTDFPFYAPEDVYYGIGVSNLSNISDACEQAKFNAVLDLLRKISKGALLHDILIDNPLPDNFLNYLPEDWNWNFSSVFRSTEYARNFPEDWIQAGIYFLSEFFDDGYYNFLSEMTSGSAFTELNKHVVVGARTKTSNGNIWYLVYINKTIDLSTIDIIGAYIGDRGLLYQYSKLPSFNAEERIEEAFRRAYAEERMEEAFRRALEDSKSE